MESGDDTMDFHFAFKVVVIGDPSVGKSTLVHRHTTEGAGDANAAMVPTAGQIKPPQNPFPKSTGITFKNKVYVCDGRTYKVQYWDAPGAERYQKLTARYCAGAAAAICVFDLSNRITLDHLEDWISRVEKSGKVIKVLVGNCSDTERSRAREIPHDVARRFAEKHGMQYFETSGLNGTGVNEAFSALFSQVVASIPNPPEPSLLLKRGITIGRKLAENTRFRRALFSLPTADTTDTVDWI